MLRLLKIQKVLSDILGGQGLIKRLQIFVPFTYEKSCSILNSLFSETAVVEVPYKKMFLKHSFPKFSSVCSLLYIHIFLNKNLEDPVCVAQISVCLNVMECPVRHEINKITT